MADNHLEKGTLGFSFPFDISYAFFLRIYRKSLGGTDSHISRNNDNDGEDVEDCGQSKKRLGGSDSHSRSDSGW